MVRRVSELTTALGSSPSSAPRLGKVGIARGGLALLISKISAEVDEPVDKLVERRAQVLSILRQGIVEDEAAVPKFTALSLKAGYPSWWWGQREFLSVQWTKSSVTVVRPHPGGIDYEPMETVIDLSPLQMPQTTELLGLLDVG